MKCVVSWWMGLRFHISYSHHKSVNFSSRVCKFVNQPPHHSVVVMAHKREVTQLYKNLLYMGNDYPKGYVYFRDRLKRAFMKNKDERDEVKIKELLKLGEFVKKELEALYMLKKYRTLKQRYYNDENENK